MLAYNEDSEQMNADRFRRTKSVTASRVIAASATARAKAFSSLVRFALTSDAFAEVVTP